MAVLESNLPFFAQLRREHIFLILAWLRLVFGGGSFPALLLNLCLAVCGLRFLKEVSIIKQKIRAETGGVDR